MYDEEPSDQSAGNSASSNSTNSNSNSSSGGKQQVAPKPDFRCSYCGKMFVRADSSYLPFCSSRCKQIDLGMWLTESYGMPYEGDELDALRRREEDDS